ncbi:hypothetical protein OV079_38390 [Nannocystis pusilla]|uniref:Uncharacterized protein n=1 Tax=Nannocystis pusilla TaxID=889268 RepID=A0A9X3F4K8_9BACT|nr:hypothetical protein [Nannocystis pusilla]MCY1011331.1 hypothetical protein [Nannocystis pusilla]
MLARACRGGALVLLAAGWAALRLQMNGEYKGATWAQIAEFTAPLPFGHRPLMALVAWPLRAATDWPLALVWGVCEAAAALGLWFALRVALRPLVGARWDMFFATCFFALLAFPFLLKHKWAVFYPWDTPAMAFTAAGLALVADRRFAAATALCFVAALNRESAALIPAAALALHVGSSGHVLRDIRGMIRPALAMVAAFVAARLAVALALPDNPGPALHFAIGKNTPRWLHNLEWLAEPVHWLWLPMYFALLPLAWVLLWKTISADHRRLALVALAWFAGLMLVANIYEPRVYGELLVLLYVPVAAAACRWLRADTLGAA